MNNCLSIYPKYKLHTNLTPADYMTNVPMTTGAISQWSKGEDTFVLTRSLLLFSFLKLIQINIILSDNVNILYIYTVTPVLTKP
jgi:hypothetical protein